MIDFLMNISASAAAMPGIGGIWDAIVTDFSKLNTAAVPQSSPPPDILQPHQL